MRTTGEGAVGVSVVIAARNAEAYLEEAIGSVLRQTLPPGEVIVVDDGSTDRTASVAGHFGGPVRCIAQPPSGPGAALNLGLAEARGRLLAFLDADDLWLPEKQALQVRALSHDRKLDMVFGHARHFLSAELTASQRKQLVLPHGLSVGLCKGAMLIRREAFERVGPFESRRKLGEFVDWYARAVDVGLRSLVLPEAVLCRRLHADNSGVRERDFRTDYVRTLKTVLDRRRAGAT